MQLAGVLLCNLDLLPLNVEVPWAASYALGSAVQMIAFWYGGSYFHTAWAAAYDQLAQQPVQMPKPRPDPKKLPWDEYNK